MTPAEIQRELEELDTRLERLRIKYDQYFTGIEKMLPFVARKDVDRRFQSLHREQMRNTGMRFKFQSLVQRFTSYQTYWNRITRQIEEGTFRRDVVRAQRMGMGMAAVREAQENAGAQELDADELEEIEPLEPEPAAAQPQVSMRAPGLDDPAPSRQRPVAPKLEDVSEPSIAPHPPREDIEDFSVPPRAITPPPRAAARSPGSPVVPLAPLAPAAPVAPLAPAAPLAPLAPAAPAPPAAEAPRASGQVPSLRPVPRPPALQPQTPQGSVPPMPMRPPQQPSSAPPVAPSTPPAPRTFVPRPPPEAPVRTPQPTAPPRPSAPVVGEDPAMRQLYDRYIAARKQTGEHSDVRFETVAKQVKDTLPRLAEKYQDADVRLDVTIKDGKAILRPVVTMRKKP